MPENELSGNAGTAAFIASTRMLHLALVESVAQLSWESGAPGSMHIDQL